MNNDPLTKLLMKQCNLSQPEIQKADELDPLSLLLIKEHHPEHYEAIQKARKEAQDVVDDVLVSVLQQAMSLTPSTAQAVVKASDKEGVLDILKQCSGKEEQAILAKKATKKYVVKRAIEAGDIAFIEQAKSMTLGELTALLSLRKNERVSK